MYSPHPKQTYKLQYTPRTNARLSHERRRARVFPTAEATRQRAHERVFKRVSEVAVEVRVDERVERRVEVADPEQHTNHHVRRLARLAANVRCDVPAGKMICDCKNHTKLLFVIRWISWGCHRN